MRYNSSSNRGPWKTSMFKFFQTCFGKDTKYLDNFKEYLGTKLKRFLYSCDQKGGNFKPVHRKESTSKLTLQWILAICLKTRLLALSLTLWIIFFTFAHLTLEPGLVDPSSGQKISYVYHKPLDRREIETTRNQFHRYGSEMYHGLELRSLLAHENKPTHFREKSVKVDENLKSFSKLRYRETKEIETQLESMQFDEIPPSPTSSSSSSNQNQHNHENIKTIYDHKNYKSNRNTFDSDFFENSMYLSRTNHERILSKKLGKDKKVDHYSIVKQNDTNLLYLSVNDPTTQVSSNKSDPDITSQMDKDGFLMHAYNVTASDALPLNREVPDFRPEG